MRLTRICCWLLIVPLPGCALFRRPMVEVDHLRVELASGVELEDVVEGVGRPARPDDEVTLDYTGWLADGTLFDSSIDRGVPITFELADAPLEGWREGIPGMKAGGKRRLFLPPESAYGSEGVPGLIPPDTALVFLIELWAIAGEDPPVQPPRSQRLDDPAPGREWSDEELDGIWDGLDELDEGAGGFERDDRR